MPSRGPARFRSRGVVERVKSDPERDASGRVDLSNHNNWETFVDRRMEIIAIGARELLHAEQVTADITHRVTMRRDSVTSRITPEMRLIVGSKIFQITKAIEIGNPAMYIELSCVEVV